MTNRVAAVFPGMMPYCEQAKKALTLAHQKVTDENIGDYIEKANHAIQKASAVVARVFCGAEPGTIEETYRDAHSIINACKAHAIQITYIDTANRRIDDLWNQSVAIAEARSHGNKAPEPQDQLLKEHISLIERIRMLLPRGTAIETKERKELFDSLKWQGILFRINFLRAYINALATFFKAEKIVLGGRCHPNGIVAVRQSLLKLKKIQRDWKTQIDSKTFETGKNSVKTFKNLLIMPLITDPDGARMTAEFASFIESYKSQVRLLKAAHKLLILRKIGEKQIRNGQDPNAMIAKILALPKTQEKHQGELQKVAKQFAAALLEQIDLVSFLKRIDGIYKAATSCFKQIKSIDHLIQEMLRISTMANRRLSFQEYVSKFNAKIAEFNAFLRFNRETDALALLAEEEIREGYYPEERIALLKRRITPPIEGVESEYALEAITAYISMMVAQLDNEWEKRALCAIL